MIAMWKRWAGRVPVDLFGSLPVLLLLAASASAAPMRYELDLTPTATHAAATWDHDVPLNGPFNCDGACHTGAAGNFGPSGSIATPSQSGTFLLSPLIVRYYGDSAGVKDYPDTVTGDTLTAKGHYLAGGRATVSVPVSSPRYLHARSIVVGQGVCALLYSGTVKCWGRNRFGSLGNGTDQDSNIPVATVSFPSSVKQISAYFRHACAVTQDGAAWCWGSNFSAELGSPACPTFDNYGDCINPTPTRVAGLPGPVSSVAVGGDDGDPQFTCANLVSGAVWCWGGDGALPPAPVAGLSGVKAITANAATACALQSDGSIWCWGTSLQGPTQIQGLGKVKSISGSCAVASNGTVSCWYSGTPSQVAGLSNVVSLADSSIFGNPKACAARSDGSVWCWDASLVATQVNGFQGITAISRGGDYSDVICGIRNDETVWCMNDNGWGQLGNPVVNFSNTPVQVVSGADAHKPFTGSFDPANSLFVSTDNSHHSIGIGSGWPVPSAPTNPNVKRPPLSPTYPGGIMSNQYACDPGNPYDTGCGSNPSAIDNYDLRTALVSATGHKIANQDFPGDFPASNGPLALIGGGTIRIDPLGPTDNEHSSVGYTGSFSATALTPMSALSASGGATAATASAAVNFVGRFTLGAGGKAFDPAVDDIVFGYGPYTAYVPAGTLESDDEGASYAGDVNGSTVQISIRPLRNGSYAYSIAVQSVDMTALVVPANVDLYIGDNAGSAPAVPR